VADRRSDWLSRVFFLTNWQRAAASKLPEAVIGQGARRHVVSTHGRGGGSGTGNIHIFFAQPNQARSKSNQHHLKARDAGYSKIEHHFIFDVFWMSYVFMNFRGGSWFIGWLI
jgi:hypothetical protein